MIVVTADCIALLGGKLVLVERKNPPEGLAMPGGILEEGETLEQTAGRELHEETGLTARNLEQFRTYSSPESDPRGQYITTVFVVEAEGEPQAGSDAKAVRLIEPSEIDSLRDRFAADHYEILQEWRCSGSS